MAEELPPLRVGLLLDSRTFVAETRKVGAAVDKLGRDVNQQTAALTTGFNAAAASVKAFAAGFLAIGSVTTLANAVRQTTAWADSLQEASGRIGIGVQQLQRMQQAGELTNVSQEKITTSLQRFVVNLGKAQQGEGDLLAALKRSGIELSNQDGSLRSVNAVFDEFAETIANSASSTEAATLAQAAFGRGGIELITTLREMQESFDDLNVLTDEQVKKLGEYDDVITKVTQRLGFEFKETLVTSIREVEALGAAMDALFGTSFVQSTTTVNDLNDKLVESTNLLQRYRDAAEQVAAGTAIAQPGTTERVVDLERERLALLNQLKRASEDAATGVDVLAAAADAASEDMDKFADAIRKANSAAGEGLGDVEFAASNLHVEEARKEMDAFNRAQEEQARTAKQAAAEAQRLAESRQRAIGDLQQESENTRILIAAQQQSESFYQRTQAALEGENIARRLGLDLSSDMAQAIVEESVVLAQLTDELERNTQETERRFDTFRQMNEEEMGRRMGQATAGGLSSASKPAEEVASPFIDAAEMIGDAFVETFDQILIQGVENFEDLTRIAQGLFVNLGQNIGRTMGESIGALGAAGGPLGAAAGGIAGVGLGFGLNAVIKAIAGGGRQSNNVSIGGGFGAGAGGTGAAAQFVAQLDQQLAGLLDARSEALVNAALRAAPSTSVQYSKTPSANDLANLARGRIGPAATALGFNAGAIATGTPEQMTQNLQSAIAIFRQLEGFRIGPVATQFRDLNDEFAELGAEAARLGISTTGLAEEWARATAELQRITRSQFSAVAAQVGAITSLDDALNQLQLEMEGAWAAATALGISTAGLQAEHQRRINLLIAESQAVDQTTEAVTQAIDAHQAFLDVLQTQFQQRGETHGLQELLGVITPLDRALSDLQLTMERAWHDAERLGVSTAGLSTAHRLQINELIREDRLQRHAALEGAGLIRPIDRALMDLQVQMERAAIEADRLGYSTKNVTREHQRLADALVREHEATIDALALSISDPFERLADPLRDFADVLETSLLNPLGQMKDAGADFRRTLDLARGGDLQAIEDLRSAGERFISESGRFGSSPAIAAATREVQAGLTEVLGNLGQAQREAAAGVEGHIDRAAQRQVDKMSELVAEMQAVKEEIKRLRR